MKNIIKIGKSSYFANRIKTIVPITLNEEYYNGDNELIIYNLSDDIEIYESKSSFDKAVLGK